MKTQGFDYTATVWDDGFGWVLVSIERDDGRHFHSQHYASGPNIQDIINHIQRSQEFGTPAVMLHHELLDLNTQA